MCGASKALKLARGFADRSIDSRRDCNSNSDMVGDVGGCNGLEIGEDLELGGVIVLA